MLATWLHIKSIVSSKIAERNEAVSSGLHFSEVCIYTTKLELILAKISDFDERLRAAAKRRLRLKQNFLFL